MNKSCKTCEYFKRVSVGDIVLGSCCEHEEHKGTYVPEFTSCPEYTTKKNLTTPFDGIKFYLIDNETGELGIKYICEDCGKIMDKPYHWWFAYPLKGTSTQRLGFHYRCKECDNNKKEEETI